MTSPSILLTSEHPRPGSAARVVRQLAGEFLRALRLESAELSVVLTTDARIRKVNRTWRQKDEATDVLSFPAGEGPRGRGQRRPLGDIVISLETARRRAREDGRPQRDELARYLAHGLLHLLGHDHHEAGEARRMARAECRLLGGAGMVAAAEAAAVEAKDREAQKTARPAAKATGKATGKAKGSVRSRSVASAAGSRTKGR